MLKLLEKQSQTTQTIRCKVRGACSIKQLTSPLILRASSANHSKKLFPYPTSPLASAKGFPCSAVKIFANSSELAWQRSNHLRNKAALSRAVVQRQVLKACKNKEIVISCIQRNIKIWVVFYSRTITFKLSFSCFSFVHVTSSAASMACCVSSSPRLATLAMTFPFAGLVTSNVLSLPTHAPLM